MAYKKDSVVNDDIGELIRAMETNYVDGTTTTSKYVQQSMHENLNKIDAYLNSRHTTGEVDSLGREKPFFNIVTAAVNIWYRATDLDRKNIKIRATKGKDTIDSFLATVHLQKWMRKTNFGAFLNDWGRSLARYGSSVVKFVEKDGELYPSVIPWQRLIVDPVDFDSNPRIEVLELTEAQLYQREGYDKDMVQKLCDARKARETLDGNDKDNKSEYIKLYEIHGNLPKSYLTGKESDSDKYVQQMHVISYVASKEKGQYDDFTLVSGQERIDPYMITHLIKEDGQTLSIGAVQHLFEAQWMMNHTVKSIKDQLDLASKLIFQTSDGNFVGQNALDAIENGDILIHKVNEPITQVANSSHDITSLQNYNGMWKGLSNELTGISESMLGNVAPSGTAWRQVEALLQQNESLFRVMTQNKGLDVEVMMRKFVIPNLKKKMDTSEEVSATLADFDITKIDAEYVKNGAIKKSNKKIKERMAKGEKVLPEQQLEMVMGEQAGIQQSLQSMGNQRFFAPDEVNWKTQFKDLEWELEVDVVDENAFNRENLATVSTLIDSMSDPARAAFFQTPEGRFLKNKVLTLTGTISPLETSSLPSPVQPAAAPVPAT